MRSHTSAPVVAGFGIRGPEDARGLASYLDGVIVGARWIELLSEGAGADGLAKVRSLARGLRSALDSA